MDSNCSLHKRRNHPLDSSAINSRPLRSQSQNLLGVFILTVDQKDRHVSTALKSEAVVTALYPVKSPLGTNEVFISPTFVVVPSA